MADKASNGFGEVGGLTEKELRWSEWWVEHREQVRKAGTALFVVVDVTLVLVGVWGFTDWLAFGGIREEQAIRQLTSAGYGQLGGVALQELQINAPIVLQGGTGKIDVLVPVENRNLTFWAEVEYRMLVNGIETPLQKGFVLPGQAKYLADLGLASDGSASVELKIEKRAWHRIDTQGATDAASFAETRLNIQGEDAVFHPSSPSSAAPASSASFVLANHAAFSYYDVDVMALLYRGDAIVGVNRVRVDRLLAGERKPMELFWFQSLPQVTNVDVIPDINIYDPEVYKSPA